MQDGGGRARFLTEEASDQSRMAERTTPISHGFRAEKESI